MLERVGGSLIGFTVRRKVLVAEVKPSLTDTEIVAVPEAFRAGRRVMVRLGPLPPKTMFPSGTRPWFEEVPLTVKSAASVSTSARVKGMGPRGVSSSVD